MEHKILLLFILYKTKTANKEINRVHMRGMPHPILQKKDTIIPTPLLCNTDKIIQIFPPPFEDSPQKGARSSVFAEYCMFLKLLVKTSYEFGGYPRPLLSENLFGKK